MVLVSLQSLEVTKDVLKLCFLAVKILMVPFVSLVSKMYQVLQFTFLTQACQNLELDFALGNGMPHGRNLLNLS